MSFVHRLSAHHEQGGEMRSIGLDIHRDFMEVAIAEGGEIRSGPRVAMEPESLELFAGSLDRSDQVALEVSGNAWEVVRLIRPHVGRIVAASPTDTGMRQARAKTDRLDARALARLLSAGQLETVWVPDEATQAMRRRLQRRSQLVRAKSAAKNEIHAALMRRLVPKPDVSDLFGKAGRRWLAELELPAAERESVSSAMRQIAFCESEIAAIEKLVAEQALASAEIQRLMSVPGVGAITAAAFMAAVGDIRRFPSPKKLVGYLGLDPIVRQSGSSEASYGRISKQGSAAGRYALVEASWSVVKAPGPSRAFYERTKGRRGASVAIVATARKLACLFWILLVGGEDYAYGQPSLRARKQRQLELTSGAPKGRGGTSVWKANAAVRDAERKMAEQAEAAYRRHVAEFKRVEALRAKQRKEAQRARDEQHKEGAGATSGRAS
jgi:transposase